MGYHHRDRGRDSGSAADGARRAKGVLIVAAAAILILVVGLVIRGREGGEGGGGTRAAVRSIEAWLTIVRHQDQCGPGILGRLPGLTSAQASNTETIVSVADTLSHENGRAARIALMTALTESGLVDVEGGLGGAHGLFQQTPPAWGSVTQVLDPMYAATAFVSNLLTVDGWQSTRPWVAAQTVQRSGAGQPGSPQNPRPGVLGGNYAVKWARAGRILAAERGVATGAGCGAGPHGGERGPASRHGLPVGYRIPAGTTRPAATAIRYAISRLGDADAWGAAGPKDFDCSGLTMRAWAAAGVRLDHSTVDQESEGRRVPPSRTAPGDLVLIPGTHPPGRRLPGHVGIYLGRSLVLSAVDPQAGVSVQSWSTFVSGGLDAVVDPLVA